MYNFAHFVRICIILLTTQCVGFLRSDTDSFMATPCAVYMRLVIISVPRYSQALRNNYERVESHKWTAGYRMHHFRVRMFATTACRNVQQKQCQAQT